MEAPPKSQKIHAKNGVEMDLSPDIASRMLNYQNGNDRLASTRKFDDALPINRRPAPADPGAAQDPLIRAAEQQADADANEEAQEAAELARIQQEEIDRRKAKGVVNTGVAQEDGSASRVNPIVASALGETFGNSAPAAAAGMPARPSAE